MNADDRAAGIPAHLQPSADWMQRWCRADADVRCAYLGGSLATARADSDSDLDVMLHAAADDTAALFQRLLDDLGADWDVVHRWLLPLPTWHGGRQAFLAVRGEPPDEPVVLDLVVNDLATAASIRVDPRRDGTPLVLHDPGHLLRVEPHGDKQYRADAAAAIAELGDRFAFARWIVRKSIRRAQWPEAYAYYLRFALEPVVLLLRARATPARWDFGLRYLDTDLPATERERVVALLPHTPGTLAVQAETCLRWQEDLLAGWDSAALGQ